jgi:hypothetical protein
MLTGKMFVSRATMLNKPEQKNWLLALDIAIDISKSTPEVGLKIIKSIVKGKAHFLPRC